MPDQSKQYASATIKGAIDSALWAGLTPDEIQAIVTAHLIDKGKI